MKLKPMMGMIVLLMVVASWGLNGEKLAVLPELMQPTYLTLDEQQFYVSDRETIYIYSLKDFKLKNKFGKAGDGPQEFRLQPGEGAVVYPQKDSLLVNGVGKILFYTKDGVYKNEINISALMAGLIQAIGKNYVGLASSMDQKTQSMAFAFVLYDSQLKKIKELKTSPFLKGGKLQFPMDTPAFWVMGDKIVTPGESNRFSIEILNSDGSKAAVINREYEKLNIPDSYREKVFDAIKTMPATKALFEQLKKMITFSSQFPPIQFFWADNNLIFISTYKEQNGQHEFFLYDAKGKFIKQLFLPFQYINAIKPCPTVFKNNTLYQVVENEDDEQWELYGIKIK